MSHLVELRKRLITCAIAIGVGFGLSYGFKEKLFKILTSPLEELMQSGDKLIYTSLPEAFFTYIKVSFLFGLLIASPVVIYQFWAFIAPGLYKKEKSVFLPIIFLSSLFFAGGSLFGYFVVFPLGFKFFLSFATETIRPLPSMKEYLSFAAKLLLAFGVCFELPLVLTALAKLGIVTTSFLKKNRKYALLLFFVASAILTPPDIISQVMLAIPLALLYELSILGAKIFGKKKEDNKEKEKASDSDKNKKEEKEETEK
ncbi:MAG: twin-arginine translocase subunit TatC [Deltaproteobacteria bacterium]|nr:twin-arginine translocase subunit TatC [Deltaproteobacteria bacterium]